MCDGKRREVLDVRRRYVRKKTIMEARSRYRIERNEPPLGERNERIISSGVSTMQ